MRREPGTHGPPLREARRDRPPGTVSLCEEAVWPRRNCPARPARPLGPTRSVSLVSHAANKLRAANRDLSPLPLELGLFTVCGAELVAPEAAVACPIRFTLEPLAAEAAIGSQLIGTLDHVSYVSGGNTTQ